VQNVQKIDQKSVPHHPGSNMQEAPGSSSDSLRPLQNDPFCPISALGSNFNPQNTQCIPVVKIFACLELEQN
jgi:hypothetical protein